MHPYIPHLLDDIKAAHRHESQRDPERRPLTLEEELADAERWATEEPEHTFGYYCGLKVEDFPPAEQLSDEDMTHVCKAYRQLLFSWNADIDLPETLPRPLKYKFMVGTLDEKFTVVNTGCITFDYCSGYAPDCPFKEYCPCLRIWNEP